MPRSIFSTDDTTAFVFKGIRNKSENWYLMSGPGSTNNNSSHSDYSNEVGVTDHLNGLRVYVTFKIFAVGSLAAPFITVTGLTERELPIFTCQTCILYMSIEGLCSGGF